MTASKFGFSAAIVFSAWTTSGQLWQVSETKVSEAEAAAQSLDLLDRVGFELGRIAADLGAAREPGT